MKNADRVKLKPKFEEKYGAWPMIGTVERKSQFGYVTVIWDDGERARFAPGSATEQLDIVTGIDAMLRHDWDVVVAGDEHCRACKVAQTDENYKSACIKQQE